MKEFDTAAEAQHAAEVSLKALDTISSADIAMVKNFQKPPDNVRMVMASVCVMLGEKPEKIADPAGGLKKVDDYWAKSKLILADMKIDGREWKEFPNGNP